MKDKKQKKNAKSPTGKYIMIGLLISLPLTLFVLLLLSSADMVFGHLVNDLLDQILRISIPSNLFGISFSLLFSFFASYCILIWLEKGSIKKEVPDRRTGEPVIAITVTSVLSVIYMLFCGIQILYLFGGLLLPNGYSYAEYAREGFFQLLFVCLMNLVLVLTCLGRCKENKILKIVLTVISVCTYIMIASSTMRMILYIQYYYLTFLRIFVLWSLLVIFLLMTGVLIYIYRQNFPLFRYSMVIVTALYIGLSFAHPDYWIARCNITSLENEDSSFFANKTTLDTWYLSRLSADAAPVLLSEENRKLLSEENMIISGIYHHSDWHSDYESCMELRTEDMSPRSFNLSKFVARQALAADASSHSKR